MLINASRDWVVCQEGCHRDLPADRVGNARACHWTKSEDKVIYPIRLPTDKLLHIQPSISIQPSDVAEVYPLIGSPKDCRPGWDDISSKVCRSSLDSFVTTLTHVLNHFIPVKSPAKSPGLGIFMSKFFFRNNFSFFARYFYFEDLWPIPTMGTWPRCPEWRLYSKQATNKRFPTTGFCFALILKNRRKISS